MKTLVRSAALALAVALILAAPAAALDGGVTVSVSTWQAGSGHAYVGVQAAGHWAVPGNRGCVSYYSIWSHRATIFTDLVRDEWFVTVHTCSGSVVNPLSPTMVVTKRTTPPIGITRQDAGVLRLDLGVAVTPATAPAGTLRTVTAGLSGDWQGSVAANISAAIVPGSVHVRSWSVDFGDGTGGTLAASASAPDRLATTHAYGAGGFTVTVTAHVAGRAYGAFLAPDGSPFETTVPFAVDITNAAGGVSGLPIDYIPPVVTVGGSPSGTLPGGTAVPPDAVGHAAIFWPRGLPCRLFVRATIVTEGFMRSGGVVIGGGSTRLVSYRYTAGINDASNPTRTGTYPAATPIRIQWNTPLPGTGSYPVPLVLILETTYDDGTVRTTQVAGVVSVTVVYSAAAE
jgi:hypothetical protein